jgi:NAD(P)-dependent dehydrogenase (short-subunit alcohol dehydrogenase family)
MSSAPLASPLALHERTILVTGASSGIGRETAIVLSELGAHVVIAGRDPGRLEETRSRMQGPAHRIETFDLTHAAAIPGWIKKITQETGPLSGLVHCAGIHQAVPLRVISPASIETVMAANVTSAIMLVSGFRQKGCSLRGGSVVLLSSVAGLVGQPAIGAYSASKAALIGFTKSAAMELAPEGLRVNCVAPGFVQTEMAGAFREKLTPEQFEAIEKMHPLGLGRPRDVAQAVAFLVADTGRWITGTTLTVDGGYTAR